MKRLARTLLSYLPWLLLLLLIDAFAGLLLWIADARAFCSLLLVILLATLLFFSALCCALLYLEQKREEAFWTFLDDPDLCQEEALLRIVSPARRPYIRRLARHLRDGQNARARLQTQLNDYEEYVESWAHETKTPLSLLTLLLDNRREECSEAVSFKLDYIRNRIQESVDQMLFYARLKGSRKDYLFEPLTLRLCIEEVLEDYEPLLHEKQFRIRTALSGDTVYSDRRGLRFLLGQIVSNSVKYSGADPELTFESFPENGRYLLRIRDNGIGVRSCDLPYIFEKGFTGDSGTERKKPRAWDCISPEPSPES